MLENLVKCYSGSEFLIEISWYSVEPREWFDSAHVQSERNSTWFVANDKSGMQSVNGSYADNNVSDAYRQSWLSWWLLFVPILSTFV